MASRRRPKEEENDDDVDSKRWRRRRRWFDEDSADDDGFLRGFWRRRREFEDSDFKTSSTDIWKNGNLLKTLRQCATARRHVFWRSFIQLIFLFQVLLLIQRYQLCLLHSDWSGFDLILWFDIFEFWYFLDWHWFSFRFYIFGLLGTALVVVISW